MSDQPTIHDTFVLTRAYPWPPEKAFAAFSDPAKKRRWFGDDEGRETVAYEMDFRPGGLEHARFRMRDTTPFPGVEMTNDSQHLIIVPNRRIVLASVMAMAGTPFSASLCTFEFEPAATGTDLIFTHQGAFFENSDGPQMRKGGWTVLFDKLGAALAG